MPLASSRAADLRLQQLGYHLGRTSALQAVHGITDRNAGNKCRMQCGQLEAKHQGCDRQPRYSYLNIKRGIQGCKLRERDGELYITDVNLSNTFLELFSKFWKVCPRTISQLCY